MTYTELNQLFDNLNDDFTSEYGHVDSYMSMDIASDLIRNEKHIQEAITKHYPDVTDQIVFLAEQICG
jgi:hypothetical protein